MPVGELVQRALGSDRIALAKLITLVENMAPGSEEALDIVYSRAGKAHVIGVTGPPGVGKSSLVSQLIKAFRQRGRSVGIVAVDPNSPVTGGAILGDRLRMQEHFGDREVFIRSTGTRGALGGLAQSTRNIVNVLDACGKDVIIVETAGAGQPDVEIVNCAETVVVTLMPNMGDEIQALKAGILEIGDIFVVNKSDIENAEKTRLLIKETLELEGGVASGGGWGRPVLKTVATTGEGVEALVEALEAHKKFLQSSPKALEKALLRTEAELADIVSRRFSERLRKALKEPAHRELLEKIRRREISPYAAAQEILDALLERK